MDSNEELDSWLGWNIIVFTRGATGGGRGDLGTVGVGCSDTVTVGAVSSSVVTGVSLLDMPWLICDELNFIDETRGFNAIKS